MASQVHSRHIMCCERLASPLCARAVFARVRWAHARHPLEQVSSAAAPCDGQRHLPFPFPWAHTLHQAPTMVVSGPPSPTMAQPMPACRPAQPAQPNPGAAGAAQARRGRRRPSPAQPAQAAARRMPAQRGPGAAGAGYGPAHTGAARARRGRRRTRPARAGAGRVRRGRRRGPLGAGWRRPSPARPAQAAARCVPAQATLGASWRRQKSACRRAGATGAGSKSGMPAQVFGMPAHAQPAAAVGSCGPYISATGDVQLCGMSTMQGMACGPRDVGTRPYPVTAWCRETLFGWMAGCVVRFAVPSPHIWSHASVSYTHLTLPTNREV